MACELPAFRLEFSKDALLLASRVTSTGPHVGVGELRILAVQPCALEKTQVAATVPSTRGAGCDARTVSVRATYDDPNYCTIPKLFRRVDELSPDPDCEMCLNLLAQPCWKQVRSKAINR